MLLVDKAPQQFSSVPDTFSYVRNRRRKHQIHVVYVADIEGEFMNNSLDFEDLKAGEVCESIGRTITETDMTMFSMLSGDWNPIHCDQEFASKSRFGLVNRRLQLVNQNGEVTQDGVSGMLILKQTELQIVSLYCRQDP